MLEKGNFCLLFTLSPKLWIYVPDQGSSVKYIGLFWRLFNICINGHTIWKAQKIFSEKIDKATTENPVLKIYTSPKIPDQIVLHSSCNLLSFCASQRLDYSLTAWNQCPLLFRAVLTSPLERVLLPSLLHFHLRQLKHCQTGQISSDSVGHHVYDTVCFVIFFIMPLWMGMGCKRLSFDVGKKTAACCRGECGCSTE